MPALNESRIKRFFENQLWHIMILAFLFISFSFIYDFLEVPHGQWLGFTTKQWFMVAIITPLVHQPYVWLCWRGELYYQAVTRVFGRYGFLVFAIVFFILIFIRFFSMIGVCVSDYQSLSLSRVIRYPLAFFLHLPGIYAIYSVIRYFGFRRTPGEDHFKPEEYRSKKFVRQGMYKYTSNVMYAYAGMMFLALAVFCASKAGLLISFYMYATVWTHYFCTEKPDIEYIYK